MYYIKSIYTHEIERSKSKFIAVLYPLSSKDDVKLLIEETKKSYPKANHYCHASIFGIDGEFQTASDDGEPQKTAGVPILEVLKHQKLTNVLCVVIRYFGGTKLGAGGLIRAYSNATSEALKSSILFQRKVFEVASITFKYPLINPIEQFLENKASILDKQFLEDVTYKVIFDQSDISVLNEILHLLDQSEKLKPEVHYLKV